MSRALDLFNRLRLNGESEIDRLIADFQSENLWLDFKQAATAASDTTLHISDRENFAKAVSGFGNSDGGVIVWGVDCRRDKKTGADLPGSKVPVTNAGRFGSWLENAVSSCTAPPHSGVVSEALVVPGAVDGFVATYIAPALNAPLQCIQPSSKPLYYMRAGSNFLPTPHAVLAGMFGRRPQPVIDQTYFVHDGSVQLGLGPSVTIHVYVRLMNRGPIIAEDLYLNLSWQRPGTRTDIKFGQVDEGRWEVSGSEGMESIISRPAIRLAPRAALSVGVLEITLRQPFDQAYTLSISYGCSGAEPHEWSVRLEAADVEAWFKRSNLAAPPSTRDELLRAFLGPAFGA